MNEIKNDRRTRKTDKAIFLALTELTKRKRLDEISVTAICQEADISRQAFYSRFRDPIHAVKSYVDAIYAQGLEIPVAYETSEKRKQKLNALWENNMPVLKLILVTAKDQYIYDYFVETLARLYMELNKIPRIDVEIHPQDEMMYEVELNLATLRAKMLKSQIESGGDGSREKNVMNLFFENFRRIS
jgi:AcrR family transcriptional regulator